MLLNTIISQSNQTNHPLPSNLWIHLTSLTIQHSNMVPQHRCPLPLPHQHLMTPCMQQWCMQWRINQKTQRYQMTQRIQHLHKSLPMKPTALHTASNSTALTTYYLQPTYMQKDYVPAWYNTLYPLDLLSTILLVSMVAPSTTVFLLNTATMTTTITNHLLIRPFILRTTSSPLNR